MTSATRANEFVVDTVALVFHLEKRRIDASAKAILTAAEAGQGTIHIPGIVFAEVLYLSEKGRIQTNLAEVGQFLATHANFCEYPMDLAVVHVAAEITDIHELHDRLIAATARLIDAPVLTNDVEHSSIHVRASHLVENSSHA